jgi:hypothetical protein
MNLKPDHDEIGIGFTTLYTYLNLVKKIDREIILGQNGYLVLL